MTPQRTFSTLYLPALYSCEGSPPRVTFSREHRTVVARLRTVLVARLHRLGIITEVSSHLGCHTVKLLICNIGLCHQWGISIITVFSVTPLFKKLLQICFKCTTFVDQFFSHSSKICYPPLQFSKFNFCQVAHPLLYRTNVRLFFLLLLISPFFGNHHSRERGSKRDSENKSVSPSPFDPHPLGLFSDMI